MNCYAGRLAPYSFWNTAQRAAQARASIETHHGTQMLRRCLLRSTGWPLAMGDINRCVGAEGVLVVEQGLS